MGIGVAGSASSPSAPVAPCLVNWGDDNSSARSGGSACSGSYPYSVTSSAEVRITLVSDGRKCLGGKALQVRGAGPADKPIHSDFSMTGRLQVAPSQTSAPAEAATAVLCTAAASQTALVDAIQNALALTVRSFGVEGVSVAVADTQCSRGAEVLFSLQLRCESADPSLAAAVAQSLMGPAGVAAALAQLKRTTSGLFGEAGVVLLAQLRLDTVAAASAADTSRGANAGVPGAAGGATEQGAQQAVVVQQAVAAATNQGEEVVGDEAAAG
eukprot:XP_001695793.1 predicted protein [Chlamydomonas reinhardtii]